MKKALVILSGGQDSTLCLDIAVRLFGAAHVAAVTFAYGQRHSREIDAAIDVAAVYGVEHEIVSLGPILKGTSPLTDPGAELEQYTDYATMDATIGGRVEKTFVPMRNALFITIAANRAVCMGATHLFTGVCQADNANYPDCRERFIRAQEFAVNEALGNLLGASNYLHVVTPLMHLSKAQSIELFERDGRFEVLALTHTAYDGQYPPVGKDHATVLRAQGFLEAGLPDPLIVRAAMAGLMELPKTPNYVGIGLTNLRELISDVLGEAGHPTKKAVQA
jgi:7-cyano-7-deazaguanine synthase